MPLERHVCWGKRACGHFWKSRTGAMSVPGHVGSSHHCCPWVPLLSPRWASISSVSPSLTRAVGSVTPTFSGFTGCLSDVQAIGAFLIGAEKFRGGPHQAWLATRSRSVPPESSKPALPASPSRLFHLRAGWPPVAPGSLHRSRKTRWGERYRGWSQKVWG